jgi:hypothetical protein
VWCREQDLDARAVGLRAGVVDGPSRTPNSSRFLVSVRSGASERSTGTRLRCRSARHARHNTPPTIPGRSFPTRCLGFHVTGDRGFDPPQDGVNKFYKKQCQEKSSPSIGGREDFWSRDPAHSRSSRGRGWFWRLAVPLRLLCRRGQRQSSWKVEQAKLKFEW